MKACATNWTVLRDIEPATVVVSHGGCPDGQTAMLQLDSDEFPTKVIKRVFHHHSTPGGIAATLLNNSVLEEFKEGTSLVFTDVCPTFGLYRKCRCLGIRPKILDHHRSSASTIDRILASYKDAERDIFFVDNTWCASTLVYIASQAIKTKASSPDFGAVAFQKMPLFLAVVDAGDRWSFEDWNSRNLVDLARLLSTVPLHTYRSLFLMSDADMVDTLELQRPVITFQDSVVPTLLGTSGHVNIVPAIVDKMPPKHQELFGDIYILRVNVVPGQVAWIMYYFLSLQSRTDLTYKETRLVELYNSAHALCFYFYNDRSRTSGCSWRQGGLPLKTGSLVDLSVLSQALRDSVNSAVSRSPAIARGGGHCGASGNSVSNSIGYSKVLPEVESNFEFRDLFV